jgi:hypothetical protein
MLVECTLNGLSMPGSIGSRANTKNRVTLSLSSCQCKSISHQIYDIHKLFTMYFKTERRIDPNLNVLSKYI